MLEWHSTPGTGLRYWLKVSVGGLIRLSCEARSWCFGVGLGGWAHRVICGGPSIILTSKQNQVAIKVALKRGKGVRTGGAYQSPL